MAARTDQGTVIVHGWDCDFLPWHLSANEKVGLLRSQGKKLTNRFLMHLLRELEGKEIRQYFTDTDWETLLVLLEGGTVEEWGKDRCKERNIPPNLPKTKQLASSDSHSIALLSDGNIRCWRHSNSASDDSFGTSRAPLSDRPFLDVAVGSEHCVALRDDGVVVAWGDNRAKQCDVRASKMPARAVAASRHWTAVLLDSGEVTVSGMGCHFLPWDIGELWTRELLLGQSNRLEVKCIESLLIKNPKVCIKRGSSVGIECFLLDSNHLVVASSGWRLVQNKFQRLIDIRVIPAVKDFGIGANFIAILFDSGRVVSFSEDNGSEVQIAPSALVRDEIEEIYVRKRGVWARSKGSAIHVWGHVRNLRRCPWESSPEIWAEFITKYGHSVSLSTLPPNIAQHRLVAPLLNR